MYRTLGMLITLTLLSAPALVNADPPPPPKAKASTPRKSAEGSPRKPVAPQTPAKMRVEKGKQVTPLQFTLQQIPEDRINTTREPRRTRHPLLTPEDQQRVRTSHPIVRPDTKSATKHIPVQPEIRIQKKQPPVEKKN
jgi:hypothetical protein